MSYSQESPAVQALYKKYQASLPRKAEALREELSAMVNGDGKSALASLLHQLAGSAGMYGLDDVAAKARVALQLIEEGSEEASETSEMHAAVRALCVTLENQTN